MSAQPVPAVRRVATYERVSSEDQRDRATIRTQTDELARRLAREPDVELVERYADDGVSGTIPLAERAAGGRLMRDAAAGRIDELWVYKLDRLGRDAVDLLVVRRRCIELGIRIISVVEAEPDLLLLRCPGGDRRPRPPGVPAPFGRWDQPGRPGGSLLRGHRPLRLPRGGQGPGGASRARRGSRVGRSLGRRPRAAHLPLAGRRGLELHAGGPGTQRLGRAHPLRPRRARGARSAHAGSLAGGPHPQPRGEQRVPRRAALRAPDDPPPGADRGVRRAARLPGAVDGRPSDAGAQSPQPEARQSELPAAGRHPLRRVRPDVQRLAGSPGPVVVSLQRAAHRAWAPRGSLPQRRAAGGPVRAARVGRHRTLAARSRGDHRRVGRRRRARRRTGRGRGRVDHPRRDTPGPAGAATAGPRARGPRPPRRRGARRRARARRGGERRDRAAPGFPRPDS